MFTSGRVRISSVGFSPSQDIVPPPDLPPVDSNLPPVETVPSPLPGQDPVYPANPEPEDPEDEEEGGGTSPPDSNGPIQENPNLPLFPEEDGDPNDELNRIRVVSREPLLGSWYAYGSTGEKVALPGGTFRVQQEGMVNFGIRDGVRLANGYCAFRFDDKIIVDQNTIPTPIGSVQPDEWYDFDSVIDVTAHVVDGFRSLFALVVQSGELGIFWRLDPSVGGQLIGFDPLDLGSFEPIKIESMHEALTILGVRDDGDSNLVHRMTTTKFSFDNRSLGVFENGKEFGDGDAIYDVAGRLFGDPTRPDPDFVSSFIGDLSRFNTYDLNEGVFSGSDFDPFSFSFIKDPSSGPDDAVIQVGYSINLSQNPSMELDDDDVLIRAETFGFTDEEPITLETRSVNQTFEVVDENDNPVTQVVAEDRGDFYVNGQVEGELKLERVEGVGDHIVLGRSSSGIRTFDQSVNIPIFPRGSNNQIATMNCNNRTTNRWTLCGPNTTWRNRSRGVLNANSEPWQSPYQSDVLSDQRRAPVFVFTDNLNSTGGTRNHIIRCSFDSPVTGHLIVYGRFGFRNDEASFGNNAYGTPERVGVCLPSDPLFVGDGIDIVPLDNRKTSNTASQDWTETVRNVTESNGGPSHPFKCLDAGTQTSIERARGRSAMISLNNVSTFYLYFRKTPSMRVSSLGGDTSTERFSRACVTFSFIPEQDLITSSGYDATLTFPGSFMSSSPSSDAVFTGNVQDIQSNNVSFDLVGDSSSLYWTQVDPVIGFDYDGSQSFEDWVGLEKTLKVVPSVQPVCDWRSSDISSTVPSSYEFFEIDNQIGKVEAGQYVIGDYVEVRASFPDGAEAEEFYFFIAYDNKKAFVGDVVAGGDLGRLYWGDRVQSLDVVPGFDGLRNTIPFTSVNFAEGGQNRFISTLYGQGQQDSAFYHSQSGQSWLSTSQNFGKDAYRCEFEMGRYFMFLDQFMGDFNSFLLSKESLSQDFWETGVNFPVSCVLWQSYATWGLTASQEVIDSYEGTRESAPEWAKRPVGAVLATSRDATHVIKDLVLSGE